MLISIPDFTMPEVEKIKALANFTEQENMLFDLRKENTIEKSSEIMHVSLSTAKRINKKMIAKIIKVI